MRTQIILAIFMAFLMGSCATKKDIYYMQDVEDVLTLSKQYELSEAIQVNDELMILVSSSNLEAARPFNLYKASSESRGEAVTYLVDSKGDIDMPTLGKIKVIGKTRIELRDYLENELKRYLKDVVVNVRIQNFKVTILGEVKTPGTYLVNSEKINLFQALGLAGDLDIKGKRNNIILIREHEGHKQYQKIDLTKADIVNAPYYYLQQNDVLYVSPNSSRVSGSNLSPLFSYTSSIISTALSIFNTSLLLTGKDR